MARRRKHSQAAPHQKLATALAKLKDLQADGRRVFQSSEFSRSERERLTKQGFLRDVVKGWLMSSSPGTAAGDSTPWHASFWQFCARYCDSRFQTGWHLSPEQSLLLHAESTIIPGQVVVYTPRGANNTINLPFGTSLYDLKQDGMPPAEDLMEKDGLRQFTRAAALTRVPESFFSRHPVEVQLALAGIKDSSEVLPRLLEGGHTAVAGWLAGAFRRTGRPAIADQIMKAMKDAGYDLRESDPFSQTQVFGTITTGVSPIVGRIHAMWEATRDTVVSVFPEAPGLPKNKKEYLRFVDEIYQSDAYHSLSIEGYRVTPELVERVRAGNWQPDDDETDRKNRDALAARGYWQAFQSVKESVSKIINGAQAGKLIRDAHRDWYSALFAPSVQAGLIGAGALAGYRNQPVFLRGSRHVPPRAAVLPDAMTALFDCLEREESAGVRAVLGHWLFGFIHPYPDGNGRIARFVMNAMLASGGYPWTVIRVEDRDAYLEALETASVGNDIAPFCAFVAERVGWSMEQAAKQTERNLTGRT